MNNGSDYIETNPTLIFEGYVRSLSVESFMASELLDEFPSQKYIDRCEELGYGDVLDKMILVARSRQSQEHKVVQAEIDMVRGKNGSLSRSKFSHSNYFLDLGGVIQSAESTRKSLGSQNGPTLRLCSLL